MTHPRTQIRIPVVAHLAANLSTAPAAPSYLAAPALRPATQAQPRADLQQA